MREIKFRGKRLDTGEWVVGSYINVTARQPSILTINNEGYDVDPATVGMYTGLRDKVAKEIYSNDIVRNTVSGKLGIILWFAPTYAGYVIFYPKHGYSPVDWNGTYNELDGRVGAFGDSHKLEVVGNLADTPTLLTKKEG